MSEKTKIYILCGFAGSGKSSFLKNMSAYLSEEKIGIIVSELRRVPGDGKVFRKNGINFTVRKNGSISCSCKSSDIINAMAEMADHSLKYLFIEKQGSIDPDNFCRVMDAVAERKGDVYKYKGAICIIDGLYFLDQLENQDVVKKQLEHCQLAVINKRDLVGKKTLERIRVKISDVNQDVTVQESQFGKFDYSFLGEDLLGIHAKACEDEAEALESKPEHMILRYDGDLKKSELSRFLKEASKVCYRIKGYFKLEDGWNLVDVMDGRVEYSASGLSERGSILVLVSRTGKSARETIEGCWERIIGKKMNLS
ncbi:MAG: hypothetical protein H6Q58_177 [Firmicutes bacterium]|nr:hypothetical protein [Bacillota bacterium]